MTELGFPLDGSTLIVGPSQAGKTRLTARAMEAWIDREGGSDVVLLEFGPEYDRDGTVLGRRLERYTDIPTAVWVGKVDAHAPRAESESEAELRELAGENAMAVADRLADAPATPAAVFVNDATIGYQHAPEEVERLLDYCATAETAVLNAFESDELGTHDPVSVRERDVVQRLRTWADRTITLGD
ncbi:hypothetical protein [Halosimplex pelagicum]|uniref:ATP-binding protein n=1 Tax=Halosimplex pelagicum TaxID=869886 RepID=A0A7D5T5Y2_9EURY|nr:hypothetical protein [Halosimplex pelagicum]QLH83751.1 hypothetical protein HZS54_19885 [Halosimplex pelagicum]